LGGYEGQDKNRHRFENKEEEESKANISGSETRWYPTVVGDSWFIGGATGIAKVMNDNKAASAERAETS